MNVLSFDNPASALTNAADEAVFQAARESIEPALPPEANPGDGVPRGTLTTQRHVGAVVYPGVKRDYHVYVPAGLDPQTPAALLVVQDARLYLGDNFCAPAMLDSLIAAGDIPPTVAVFIEPGDLPREKHNSRNNRSFEYDSLSDAYTRLLFEEILPEALAGLTISADPVWHTICGMSSGGICAWTAAWERPDFFGKVISHVGSFTNIRGGHAYPSRVRGNSQKPIRVFLQGGQNDLDNHLGHWPTANFDMAAALRFKGYDSRFEFGLGGHELRHGAAIFPATLRWLWR